jgi:hypothetical protein
MAPPSLQSLTLLMLMLPDPRARQAAYGAFKAVCCQPCALVYGTNLLLIPWLQVTANTLFICIFVHCLVIRLECFGPAGPARVEVVSTVPICLLLEESRLCLFKFQPLLLAAKRRKDAHVLGRLLELPRWDLGALAILTLVALAGPVSAAPLRAALHPGALH